MINPDPNCPMLGGWRDFAGYLSIIAKVVDHYILNQINAAAEVPLIADLNGTAAKRSDSHTA
jgi:hypothetical protein